jgi:hypothetical protein
MSNPTKAMLIAAAFAVATFRPAAAQDTPNLIWIMADDLGYTLASITRKRRINRILRRLFRFLAGLEFHDNRRQCSAINYTWLHHTRRASRAPVRRCRPCSLARYRLLARHYDQRRAASTQASLQ